MMKYFVIFAFIMFGISTFFFGYTTAELIEHKMPYNAIIIDIPLALVGIGLSAVSVYAWLKSNGKIGEGWAFIAVLCILSLKGCS